MKIIAKNKLADTEYEIYIEDPRVAKKAQAGQFVILRINDFGERVPLTVVATDPEAGWVRLIFQVIGKSTAQLAVLNTGDEIQDFVGPLGKATEIKNYGHVLMVGGGVGIAALFPIVKALKEAGNTVTTILGAKTADLLILKEECNRYSDKLILMTDDGSLGEKGLVTDAMKKVLQTETIDFGWAIGPSPMMKFATLTAMDFDLPIYVSLNPIMVDGTGMCGGCRVTVADSVKYACVDGPEFLGAEVAWDEFIARMSQYRSAEDTAYQKYREQVEAHG
ncbi:sulfide/dihydroorotate dehydrogenase-like FAD/NAD-binding protein [Enterococcus sp. HY326]|uniref:sulfide/dihydroorotate dehydrogenase-like FAD/NAD-binding protein n=1 Tax=Enterococcus sp. HY326 TaxID=2971265 RepID=UPI00223F7C53|nr:sulfide/dihydroorotate dehydrogenase-like FAD/NAD-binding protein [Enterococcus sp. HY326]